MFWFGHSMELKDNTDSFDGKCSVKWMNLVNYEYAIRHNNVVEANNDHGNVDIGSEVVSEKQLTEPTESNVEIVITTEPILRVEEGKDEEDSDANESFPFSQQNKENMRMFSVQSITEDDTKYIKDGNDTIKASGESIMSLSPAEDSMDDQYYRLSSSSDDNE